MRGSSYKSKCGRSAQLLSFRTSIATKTRPWKGWNGFLCQLISLHGKPPPIFAPLISPCISLLLATSRDAVVEHDQVLKISLTWWRWNSKCDRRKRIFLMPPSLSHLICFCVVLLQLRNFFLLTQKFCIAQRLTIHLSQEHIKGNESGRCRGNPGIFLIPPKDFLLVCHTRSWISKSVVLE